MCVGETIFLCLKLFQIQKPKAYSTYVVLQSMNASIDRRTSQKHFDKIVASQKSRFFF